jgi:four helix bundle protein
LEIRLDTRQIHQIRPERSDETGRSIIKSFRDLEVYQESFQLQIEIEELLKTFPESEKYLLIDQIKRCARSIPTIISEGWALRDSVKEFKNFLRRSYGSDCEMINHLFQISFPVSIFSRHTSFIVQV